MSRDIFGPNLVVCMLVAVLTTAATAHAQVAAHPTCAEGLVPVEAEGFATIIGDAGAARDEARRDALRTAVEQVVGVAIESNTLVLNYELVEDSVRTRSEGYVASHTVLASETSGTGVSVTVHACVDPNALRADLEGFGVVLREQLGNPRLVVHSEGEDDGAALVARQILEAYFARLGFDVRLGGTITCEPQEGPVAADVVICASVQSESNPLSLREDLISARATVALEAVLASTSQVLARAASPTMTQVSLSRVTGIAQALELALAPVLDPFTMQLISELNVEQATVASLELVVRGLPDFTRYALVESLLRDMRGVRLVEPRGFSEGTGSFSIQGTIRAGDLARRLEASTDPRFRVTLVLVNRVEADVAP